ncbi:hypothetical protein PR202_gb13247 [Eleusine coracana subsp. coracana]|uniref:Strictosidine synthase conserved region domain-containing protein n=1 Tax=Eleusine coracana subsp. coracana TaxID=191504 RepID=A0AAV5EPU8_ELECO|nr:hypothetical protein PR202_gb13247 [Eleusine coracana subsp. coracana]
MVTRTGDSTGRILKYDQKSNKVTVLLSDVTYPNGISISADQTHLVVALTGPCRLLKFWLQGSKAGTYEQFTDLPGYPDNVRSNYKGGYWVALHREKYELPFGKDSHLLAIRIDAKGCCVDDADIGLVDQPEVGRFDDPMSERVSCYSDPDVARVCFDKLQIACTLCSVQCC